LADRLAMKRVILGLRCGCQQYAYYDILPNSPASR
jgi:hypothetical protein